MGGRFFKQARLRVDFALLLMMLLLLASCLPTQSSQPYGTPQTQRRALLPGQQVWSQGVSSLLFGTNDTQEWTPQNIETQPTIQQALRSGGFTLIRSFFLDNATDSAVEARMHTIESSGAACLGVITNIFHVLYDLHLVKYLGKRCLLYEFGNEPDYTGIPWETYLAQWNRLIPQLRRVNPQAKFIGPVVTLEQFDYLVYFLQGVKSSQVFPDALSFHWYPCWQIDQARCMGLADSISARVRTVRILAQRILREDLPIGVSEWNFDPGNPPASYGDNASFITQFSQRALLAMISSNVAFACQFDAASYSGYGHLDLFNVASSQPKPQYYAITRLIARYRPSTR
ncbi:MAG TPA: hypothetical protein VGD98_21135 [Ktedonobacteraceae bacterium]